MDERDKNEWESVSAKMGITEIVRATYKLCSLAVSYSWPRSRLLSAQNCVMRCDPEWLKAVLEARMLAPIPLTSPEPGVMQPAGKAKFPLAPCQMRHIF